MIGGKRRSMVAPLVLLAAVACSTRTNEEVFAGLSRNAEAGSAAAQYNLGMFYNNGIGTAQNPQLAFQWFEKSALAGDPLASYKVGCYYAGQFAGVVPADEEQALRYKLTAARAGYVMAQHDVGVAYARRGDYTEATRWWQAAADQGDISALVALAHAYRQGLGVEIDLARSYEYLLVATKRVPEEEARKVQPLFDELKGNMDAAAITTAEKTAATWAPRRTGLTVRASRGIEEAMELAR